jgi:hypothetical protein
MKTYNDFEPHTPEWVTSIHLGEEVKWCDIESIGFDEGYYVYRSTGYVNNKKTYSSILYFTIAGDFDTADYIEIL